MKKAATFYCFIFFVAATAFAQQKRGGSWEPFVTKNKIAGRSECSLASSDGILYLLGGDGPAIEVEAFDMLPKTWNKKALAPIALNHFQSVEFQYKLYVLGAFTSGSFPDQIPITNIYTYDTKYDVWEKGIEIPVDRRRGGAGAAEYNGKLYLVGGITNGHSSGTNAMFDEYNPVKKTWKKLQDAPHIRDHATAVVAGSRLYVIGGRNTSYHEPNNFMAFFSKVELSVDCYDFKSRMWSTLPARLPMGTGGGTAVNLDGKIYYIGGERATANEPNAARKDTYCYDPAKGGEWVKTGDLNEARNGAGGTVYEHKIYIAGGAGGSMGVQPLGGPSVAPPQVGNQPALSTNSGKLPGPSSGRQGTKDIALEVFTLK
ncbi:hypothetical protein A0256_02880 [Mucilaginibacter sp. PAMC 26640]|nr:hypothetical protein A0256_02880 [Mucilaginibacter sp. PAMC 26640]